MKHFLRRVSVFFWLAVALSGTTSVCAAPAAGAPVLDLDAGGLAAGDVKEWANRGTAGGVFLAGPAGAPKAATVDGRPAVEFTEGRWMKSAFNVPDALTGGRPFTLALWIRPTRIHNKTALLAWGARPKDGTDFGYGRGADGAFLTPGFRSAYRRVPALNRWSQVVFTYADGTLSLYVDGELDSRHAQTIAPRAGVPLLLGTAWDGAKDEPMIGYSGAIARVQVWDRAFPAREVRNLGGRMEPFNPAPDPGAQVETRTAALRWEAGHPDARAFRVRLAAEAAALTGDAAPVLGGGPLATNAVTTGALTIGRTYHWNVEQLDASGKSLGIGPAWNFRVCDGPASEPRPRNRVAAVPKTTAELAWTPGRYAVKQDLYFGTTAEAVASGTTPLARDLPASTTRHALPGGGLETGRTYYWRVDQHNGDQPAAKGEVWSFRVEEPPSADELTFFVVSDTHYGMDPRGDEILPKLVDMMNALPGQAYPEKAGGGIIRQPRGVIHIGDCTNDGKPDQWAKHAATFGVNGEGRLVFPLYETFGNHDGGPDSPVRKGIKERNPKRPGLTHLSENGMHYSWDWNGVHFIMLGISVGDTFNPYDPQHSYDFLVKDLKAHVKPGRPVILMHHFGFDKGHSMRWWTDEARAKYLAALKGHNVLGIFHGHAHRPEIYAWEGLDIFHPPHLEVPGQPSDEPAMHGIFIVRITKNEMLVIQHNLDGTWGLMKRKSLAAPAAVEVSVP